MTPKWVWQLGIGPVRGWCRCGWYGRWRFRLPTVTRDLNQHKCDATLTQPSNDRMNPRRAA